MGSFNSVFIKVGDAILDVVEIAGISFARNPDPSVLDMDLVFLRKGAPPTPTRHGRDHRQFIEYAWLHAAQHLVTNGPDNSVFVVEPSARDEKDRIKRYKFNDYIKTLES